MTADGSTTPEYAKLVVVPVANPATVEELLRLAALLVDTDEGQVIAVRVTTSSTEDDADAVEAITAVIKTLQAEDLPITLETVVAPSIARGIIDAARQSGADLLLLGLREPRRGAVVLGSVAESVIETAPCDVLIYRAAPEPDYQRVVVLVDDITPARMAARVALHLSGHKPGCKVEAMRPQGGHLTQFEGLARIEAALDDLPHNHRVKRTVVTSGDPVAGVLARTGPEDLLVLGFSERSEFERWLDGDVSRGLLDRAEGPVIIASRLLERETLATRTWRRFLSWVRPTLTRVEQDDMVRQARVNARSTIDYTVLILISAALASLGLLLNSAAVIIGAMLVAPLMSPLIGVSIGLTVGRVRVAWRGLLTLSVGVLLALLVSYLLGALLPRLPTAEMNARAAPTLLDAAVALASGVVGAYATARKDIPAALAGVAIAAALMPPLCTVGLAAALGEPDLAYGAGVLFLTNIFSIILAGMLTFYYLGLSFRRYEDLHPRWQILSIVLLLLAAVPVGIELLDLTGQVSTENLIREEIAAQLPEGSDLIALEFLRQTKPTRVVATIRTPDEFLPQDTRALEARIAGELGEPVRLELVLLRVIRLDLAPQGSAEAPEAEAPLPEGTAPVTP